MERGHACNAPELWERAIPTLVVAHLFAWGPAVVLRGCVGQEARIAKIMQVLSLSQNVG